MMSKMASALALMKGIKVSRDERDGNGDVTIHSLHPCGKPVPCVDRHLLKGEDQ